MTLARLEIFLLINTYYWNMVHIYNTFVYFFYSWRIYYDMIFAVTIIYFFFPDFSSKELSSSEEKMEALEM